MGPFARSGRGHSIKVTTVLNNCIEKLEGKEDTGELRSELQDHEVFCIAVDVVSA